MEKWMRLFGMSLLFSVLWLNSADAKDRTVALYSINHLQSQLLPIEVGEQKVRRFLGGLSQAAGVVQRDREKYDNSIFFTTGEVLAGKLWRYFRGEPEMRALLEAGVAVNTLGKHEFDYGVGYLKTALSYNDLPIVISNIVTQDPVLLSRLRKTLILDAGSVRVGFFGLLSPRVMRTTAKPEGVSFDPDLNTIARAMVEELRKEGAELIVLLSGLYESENIALAESVAGVHVISGCGIPEKGQRDLFYVTGPDGGQTAVTWSGERAQFVGRLQVVLSGGKLDEKRTNWKLLPVGDRTSPHHKVLETATKYEQKLAQSLGRVIGRAERIIDARKKTLRNGEAPIGNFIADGIRWKVSADVALLNGGGIRSDRIYPAGDVKEQVLAELLPYGDRLCSLTLTGRDLRWALEVSASALVGAHEKDFNPDVRLHSGSFLQVSGLQVVYDLTAPPTLMKDGFVETLGSRLKSLSVLRDGEWREVRDDETYTVAVSSWMAGGGGGGKYTVLRDAPRVDVDCLDTEAFIEYFKVACRGRAALQRDGRITVTGR